MATQQSQVYCRTCQRSTLHHKEYFDAGWGCLLTLLTCGLFLLFWIPLGIIRWFNPRVCQTCGRKN